MTDVSKDAVQEGPRLNAGVSVDQCCSSESQYGGFSNN